MSNRRMTFPVIVALILLGILTAAITATAQVRKYHRKSVSSVNSVLFAVSPQKELADVVTNRLKFHLEVPRFDYNEIPQNIVGDFASVAGRTDHSAGSIAAALDKTVIPTVQEVVSTMAEYRAVYNLSEEQLAIAAVDKMKGSGLTVEDVLRVMNSAYIYLPVVTSYGETSKDGSITSTIEGYVLWYRVKRDSTGTYKAFLVSDLKDISRGEGSGKETETYKLKTRDVDGRLYARVLAVDTWARNLAVKMKQMPDFRLSAEVKNVEGGSVEAGLGKKEGLGLDDGYNVIDFYQDENGRVRAKDQGFMRARVIADNAGEPNSMSGFRSYLGGGFGRGMLLYERPRLGIDFTIKPKFFTLDIPKSDLGLFTDDVKSAYGVDAVFAMNLAKLTGISQFFLTVEGGGGVVIVSKNPQVEGTPVLYDYYVGLSKKLWFGRMNLEIGAGYGYNSILIKQVRGEQTLTASGIKIDASLNLLMSADLSAGVYVGYKMTSNITEYKINGTTYALPGSTTNFTGVSFGFGVSYALSSLPFNPFGFLSSTQIDY